MKISELYLVFFIRSSFNIPSKYFFQLFASEFMANPNIENPITKSAIPATIFPTPIICCRLNEPPTLKSLSVQFRLSNYIDSQYIDISILVYLLFSTFC